MTKYLYGNELFEENVYENETSEFKRKKKVYVIKNKYKRQ